MSFLPHSHPPRATTVNSLTCTLPEFFYLSPFKANRKGWTVRRRRAFLQVFSRLQLREWARSLRAIFPWTPGPQKFYISESLHAPITQVKWAPFNMGEVRLHISLSGQIRHIIFKWNVCFGPAHILLGAFLSLCWWNHWLFKLSHGK